jgi:hypothetical protein
MAQSDAPHNLQAEMLNPQIPRDHENVSVYWDQATGDYELAVTYMDGTPVPDVTQEPQQTPAGKHFVIVFSTAFDIGLQITITVTSKSGTASIPFTIQTPNAPSISQGFYNSSTGLLSLTVVWIQWGPGNPPNGTTFLVQFNYANGSTNVIEPGVRVAGDSVALTVTGVYPPFPESVQVTVTDQGHPYIWGEFWEWNPQVTGA